MSVLGLDLVWLRHGKTKNYLINQKGNKMKYLLCALLCLSASAYAENNRPDSSGQTPKCEDHIRREDRSGREKEVETYVPCRKSEDSPKGNGGVRR